jgi:hypothetical protein
MSSSERVPFKVVTKNQRKKPSPFMTDELSKDGDAAVKAAEYIKYEGVR